MENAKTKKILYIIVAVFLAVTMLASLALSIFATAKLASVGTLKDGADGVGVVSVEKTSSNGLVDTYTITFTNGTTTTFTVTNGSDGENGADGVGIVSVEKTSSDGLVDTYTITFTNGTSTTFTITNGSLGDSGDIGDETQIKVGSIVTRGEYPQTFVGYELNNTLLEAKDAGTLEATGKKYTTYTYRWGNGEQVECLEYLYENEKYALLEDSVIWDNGGDEIISNAYFSTEDRGNSGESYFFKVEPVRYRVMAINEETNQMTLQSVYALGSAAYSTSYSNSWESSTIRSLLNEKFLTESGVDEYALEVSNTTNCTVYDEGIGDYIATTEETTDKVWIASIEEEKAWYPSEGIGLNSTTNVLAKAPTDFALATYTYKNPVLGTTYWVFRTGGNYNGQVYFTTQDADVKVYSSFSVSGWDAAVVPVITVAVA